MVHELAHGVHLLGAADGIQGFQDALMLAFAKRKVGNTYNLGTTVLTDTGLLGRNIVVCTIYRDQELMSSQLNH